MSIKSATKFLILSVLALVLPVVVFASIGVGVGTGKIHINEPFRAGGIYDLPAIPVLNTGDEPSEYTFSVQYHEGQEQRTDMGLKPAEAWFNFTPATFSLEPGKVQTVKVTLTLPANIKPGNYFAYLEARPVKKATTDGVTSIGIAAATQLWFTVAPSNFLQGIYYRFISLYSRYHPWDTIILAVIFVVALLWFISKKFKFQIAKK
jgi:P pilus assembly chaperone PapD